MFDIFISALDGQGNYGLEEDYGDSFSYPRQRSFNYNPLHYYKQLPENASLVNYSEKSYQVIIPHKEFGERTFFFAKKLVKEKDGVYYVHTKIFNENLANLQRSPI